MAFKNGKIPQTDEEWYKYGKTMLSAAKRRIPVVEISLDNMDEMWEYEYQAKYFNKFTDELKTILASNSLGKLKQEIRLRGWEMAWITAKSGAFSYGQNVVDEYPYTPRY